MLRFSLDLVMQKQADLRRRFTAQLQLMYARMRAVEDEAATRVADAERAAAMCSGNGGAGGAADWENKMDSEVAQLKTKMLQGLQQSVQRVKELQASLGAEQTRNERLTMELVRMQDAQKRRHSNGSDSGGGGGDDDGSPSALRALRARYEDVLLENELLLERVANYELAAPPLADSPSPHNNAAKKMKMKKKKNNNKGKTDEEGSEMYDDDEVPPPPAVLQKLEQSDIAGDGVDSGATNNASNDDAGDKEEESNDDEHNGEADEDEDENDAYGDAMFSRRQSIHIVSRRGSTWQGNQSRRTSRR